MAEDQVERRRIRVTGTVQGVGFRPFVYRIATKLGLVGYVLNDSMGVLIEVQGPKRSLNELQLQLLENAPNLAIVETLTPEPIEITDDNEFTIRESRDFGLAAAPVSIDAATCADCLRDIYDSNNRRYRYPFTNCTNCGPRYTIIKSVPYDRPQTTMSKFTMCPQCQEEYDNPGDRRFHAQPNACPNCGPTLQLINPRGLVLGTGDTALRMTVSLIKEGLIAAIKGLGGYHLAVDASNDASVKLLRDRKGRSHKPFAVMVPDLEWAEKLCHLTDEARVLLNSPRRPIVTCAKRHGNHVSKALAPNINDLGIFLPYTPLHYLLLKDFGSPLVMTSGNMTDDPISYEDSDAKIRLMPIADVMLYHNRPIYIRCDDSVAKTNEGSWKLIRRARGYAPEVMRLGRITRRNIVAVGAELKNTVTVAKEDFLVTSQHIGDLEHLATYQSFIHTITHLSGLYGILPDLIVHDLHPEYLSSKFALQSDLETLAAQHHHAHIASCMFEHRTTGPVIGVAFDGLGMGTDGTLWGGEFMLADLEGFTRVAHLKEIPLPGGTKAIKEPWRMAISWLNETYQSEELEPLFAELNPQSSLVLKLINAIPQPTTTSMGRLFDAVAALLGIRSAITYEGQAAIELEMLAARGASDKYPVFECEILNNASMIIADPSQLLRQLLELKHRGVPVEQLAMAFHRSLSSMTVQICTDLASANNISTVALSGGVFQNNILTRFCTEGLEKSGLRVLTHQVIPPNDGGISTGQAVIGCWKHRFD